MEVEPQGLVHRGFLRLNYLAAAVQENGLQYCSMQDQAWSLRYRSVLGRPTSSLYTLLYLSRGIASSQDLAIRPKLDVIKLKTLQISQLGRRRTPQLIQTMAKAGSRFGGNGARIDKSLRRQNILIHIYFLFTNPADYRTLLGVARVKSLYI